MVAEVTSETGTLDLADPASTGATATVDATQDSPVVEPEAPATQAEPGPPQDSQAAPMAAEELPELSSGEPAPILPNSAAALLAATAVSPGVDLDSDQRLQAHGPEASALPPPPPPTARRSRFSWLQAAAVIGAVTVVGALVALIIHQTGSGPTTPTNAQPAVDPNLALANLTRGLVTPGRLRRTNPVSISWNPVSGAHGYQVQASTASGGSRTRHPRRPA